MTHSNLTKVKDNSNLVRDNNSSAILNVNSDELQKHRARRKLLSSKNLELSELSSRVKSLEELVNKLLNNYNIENCNNTTNKSGELS